MTPDRLDFMIGLLSINELKEIVKIAAKEKDIEFLKMTVKKVLMSAYDIDQKQAFSMALELKREYPQAWI